MTPLRLVLAICLALLPGLAAAQDDRAQTLADLRAEVQILTRDITNLRQELVTTGGATSGIAGGSALQRMDAIEAALSQLTSKTEELQNRINKVVMDGTNRIGDIEFRLTELEGGDVSKLPSTPALGGEAQVPAVAAPVAQGGTDAPELAVSEQADFDRAKEVLGKGDFRTAADLFATFTETYSGGPLSGEAQYLRGEALSQLGDTANAARAYLESFSGTPNGPRAPEALFKLGRSLGTLGQVPEACVTLKEVGVRFPTAPSAGEALTAMQGLGCS
ncbi:MAG: tol-pal system protein YbgF [Cereibacter sphaeroides]|uniref:Cell division coordinator CpoB n=1 Tax=Cereibacter sphaeroides TaxID=1063 RepID=A0A2W5UAY8_CERSP|nr:MAG: tol-pal system protein YbgF [Cereibacter sphaeroides]